MIYMTFYFIFNMIFMMTKRVRIINVRWPQSLFPAIIQNQFKKKKLSLATDSFIKQHFNMKELL